MIIIAALNSIKEFFVKKHAEQALKSLDSHTLKDIGFYQDNGRIHPLSGSQQDHANKEIDQTKLKRQPSNG
ncbi:hypothetical protein [Marinomonas algicola]|jgi:hypothetical protein|uniref:hypothetical protein n=1 Tax=Marinomonas algicola TaxID=2773454 RepID=UPI00174DC78E|nr:hypothetical protein [Marinomonas algicola]